MPFLVFRIPASGYLANGTILDELSVQKELAWTGRSCRVTNVELIGSGGWYVQVMFKCLQAGTILVRDDADAFTISAGDNTKIAAGKSLCLDALDSTTVIEFDELADRLKGAVRRCRKSNAKFRIKLSVLPFCDRRNMVQVIRRIFCSDPAKLLTSLG